MGRMRFSTGVAAALAAAWVAASAGEALARGGCATGRGGNGGYVVYRSPAAVHVTTGYSTGYGHRSGIHHATTGARPSGYVVARTVRYYTRPTTAYRTLSVYRTTPVSRTARVWSYGSGYSSSGHHSYTRHTGRSYSLGISLGRSSGYGGSRSVSVHFGHRR